MQQWAVEEGAPQGLGISPVQQTQEQQQLQAYTVQNSGAEPEPLQSYLAPVQFSLGSQEELNRRTLTQEQFTAMERSGGIVDPFGNFEDLATSFCGDQSVLNTVFPSYNGDFKQQDMFVYPIGAPLSSYDSTVPSNMSEQSLSAFPSTSTMHTQANVSPTSDWTDSRSSSIHEGASTQMPPQHQPAITTSQWQPGQSVPVDPTAQHEAFQQAAAQATQARPSPQLSMHEQPLGWPDDAFVRRASTTSLLTQSMSNVGIQTPPQHQAATFKSPAPPSNIAARRQRAPKPAALGVAALRTQSYSGAVPSGSPVQMHQRQFSFADQPLRRVRSSNYLGSVAQGRVMKSTPGSAQRSPMHYTFADAMNSPHAVRHPSHSNLAPPTPMSPKEYSGIEQSGYIQHWQVAPGNGSRQSSINENDVEHGVSYHPSVAMPVQNRTSPPHTPMFYQHQFVKSRVYGNAIMENTPPQSAPASQTCFPSNVYGVTYPPPQQTQHLPVPSQAPAQQQVHAVAMSHPHAQQFGNPVAPDQHFQPCNVIFTPNQGVNIPTTGPPPGTPFQFSNGVPMTNADGNIELVFPPQLHFVHQHQSQGQTPPQHMHTPPQVSYPFGTSAGGSPGEQTAAQPQKMAPDFFVHEYTPPEAVKRAATPRKGPVDTAPKNYAFAHTGPEHFEEKKGDEKKAKRVDSKDAGASSSSPASSNGTALTS